MSRKMRGRCDRELVDGAQGRGGESLVAWWSEGCRGGLGKLWKINSTPLFDWFRGGWVPDWRNLVTLSFSCCTLSFFPLMDATSIPTQPSIDQACHMYSSFCCDSLALQCETSGLGSPWAGYLVSKHYSGDEYWVFSEYCKLIKQFLRNWMHKNSNWLSLEIGRKLHTLCNTSNYKQSGRNL